MLTCKDVARRIASDELAHAPFFQRLGIRVHLLMCRYCRRYAGQLRAIGALARKAWSLEDEDQAEIDRLKRNILGGFAGRGPKTGDSEDADNIPRDADDT